MNLQIRQIVHGKHPQKVDKDARSAKYAVISTLAIPRIGVISTPVFVVNWQVELTTSLFECAPPQIPFEILLAIIREQ